MLLCFVFCAGGPAELEDDVKVLSCPIPCSRAVAKGRRPNEKTFLSGHCPDGSYPPPSPRGNGQRGPFFRPSKTTFRRVLQNQILIENYDENDDDNGDNFDA